MAFRARGLCEDTRLSRIDCFVAPEPHSAEPPRSQEDGDSEDSDQGQDDTSDGPATLSLRPTLSELGVSRAMKFPGWRS